MRRWEHIGGTSEKFWEADHAGATVTIRFGRNGTTGQTRVKEFGSPDEAAAYLDKAIAEKEKKGYVDVAQAPESADTEPGTSADGPAEVTATAEPPASPKEIEFPDEDAFEIPDSWREVLHPRRAGIRGPAVTVDGSAADTVRQWIDESRHRVAEALKDPDSDPELAGVAQAHLDGQWTPRGAALIADVVAVTHDGHDPVVFADAWVSMHGLAFAAQVVAELCEVKVTWQERKGGAQFEFAPPWLDQWAWEPAARRLRALLAVADDQDYRTAVDALASHRRGGNPRIVVAYLVPTETHWVDECCATPPIGGFGYEVVRTMLICALGSAEQVAALGPSARLGWDQWNLDVLTTVAEGVGPAMAPMLVDALDPESAPTDVHKLALGVLSRLPTDDAFQIMLARLDQRHVQPAVLEAAKRFPVRALRLLAAQIADGPGRTAAAARQLLTGHVLANPELTAAALPRLPAAARTVVEELTRGMTRVAEAPTEALPALLVAPPWTRKRTTSAKPIVVHDLEPPAEIRVVWAPGEQEKWSVTSSYFSYFSDRPAGGSWAEAVRRYTSHTGPGSGELDRYEESNLFLNGPQDLIRPLLADWEPQQQWNLMDCMKPIVARYESDALPVALKVAAANPASLGPLLLPFVDIWVARLMAD